MLNTDFTDRVIKSIQSTHFYWDDSLREYDIGMFRILSERFGIEKFLETTNVDEYYYNKYLKDFIEDFDPSLHQKVIDDFKDYEPNTQLNVSWFNRDDLFELINGNDDYIHPYYKEKMIGVLNFLFDKVDIESVYKNTEISKDEYEKYLKNVILKYKPNYHNEVMKRFKEEEENEN